MTDLWTDKCWGRTRCVVSSRHYSRYELQLEKGGYCSWHYHYGRANSFFVVSGIVEIATLYGPRLHVDRLTADNTLDVPSLVVHQFRVVESGEMIEEYYADRHGEVLDDDIVRLMVGGKLSSAGCPSTFEQLLPELWRLHYG